MKLLFNKNGGTSAHTEVKSLLGFLDADTKYDNIKPDIITATNSLIKLIGQEMYDKAVGYYEAADTDEAGLHFLYLVRYPIIIKAYSLYAPNNDVSHTNNGRKMRNTDNEKHAFQWMIDNDNKALEKRYYRAVDDLLIALEDEDEWKDTEAYKKVNKLFIKTADEFDEYFRIESRLILLMLEPGIRQCEQNEILPRIGKDKFTTLKNALQDGSGLSEDKDKELLSLIQEACVYHSLAWGMRRLSVNIFPEGVLQAYTSDRDTTQIKRPAAKMETEAAKQEFEKDRDILLRKIEAAVAPEPVQDPDACVQPDIITGTNYMSL